MGEAARELEKIGDAQGLSSSEKEVREAQDAVSELARSTESDSSLSVPPANLELFRKHEADIKKYAMSGLALFGL